MSSGQKVLKVLAIMLAVFIIVNIFSAVVFALAVFSEIFSSVIDTEQTVSEKRIETKVETVGNIESLNENSKIEIDLELSSLEIKIGKEFKIETVEPTDDLKYGVYGNILRIREKSSKWIGSSQKSNSKVILSLPGVMTIKEVDISMGIGKAKIEGLQTKKLEVEAGVGNMILDNVTAQNISIDGGAGNFEVKNSVLTNLDFDCGVGVTNIQGDIQGNSKISCGVGKTIVKLDNHLEKYRIQTETGIGSITLNGKKCSNSKYGNGTNLIKIDGGVGSVEITTNEEKI